MKIREAPVEGAGGRVSTHGRRAAADVGYRVWNTFEVELRSDEGGARFEARQGFTGRGYTTGRPVFKRLKIEG